MSLTYHSEHLAWQQRVNQERNRSNNFYRTTGNFYASASPRVPFPNANLDLVSTNYKSLNYNVAYTFGGSKPIRHALLDSPSRKVEDLRRQVRASRSIENSPQQPLKVTNDYLKRYADELKSKIEEEKLRRMHLEKKFNLTS